MSGRRKPGVVRDALLKAFNDYPDGATVDQLLAEVRSVLGPDVPASSVRSYLRLNTPSQFVRVSRGRYRLRTMK